jgi:hypothetical protein
MDTDVHRWRVEIHVDEGMGRIEVRARLNDFPAVGSPAEAHDVEMALDFLTSWFKVCRRAEFNILLTCADAAPESHTTSHGFLALYFVAGVLERWFGNHAVRAAKAIRRASATA